MEKVPQSIKILAPLSDFFAELFNAPGALDIELVTKGLTWKSFRKVWDQTCASSLDKFDGRSISRNIPKFLGDQRLCSKL